MHVDVTITNESRYIIPVVYTSMLKQLFKKIIVYGTQLLEKYLVPTHNTLSIHIPIITVKCISNVGFDFNSLLFA